MKASKNHNGFTFIEVIISMSIAAMSLTALFVMQGNLIRQNTRMISTWHAMVTLKNFFSEQNQKKIKTNEKEVRFEKKVDAFSLTYHAKEVGERSALKDIKNFRFVFEKAAWNYFGFENNLHFIGARLAPEEMPKEEKGKT